MLPIIKEKLNFLRDNTIREFDGCNIDGDVNINELQLILEVCDISLENYFNQDGLTDEGEDNMFGMIDHKAH